MQSGLVPEGVEVRVDHQIAVASDTRYLVTLDMGGELEVIKQNVTTSSMEVLALKGRHVRLLWDGQHMLPVAMALPDAPTGSGTDPV